MVAHPSKHSPQRLSYPARLGRRLQLPNWTADQGFFFSGRVCIRQSLKFLAKKGSVFAT